jgi:aminoglycoside 6'-N-acetyltransferase I
MELASPPSICLANRQLLSCGNLDNALGKSVAIDSTLVRIRLTQPSDAAELARLYFALWQDSSVETHRRELDALLEGKPPSTLPLINLVAEISDGHLIGFLQASLRSHADGCDPSRPVGFIEGWYVAPEYRKQGIGRRLLATAEDWARSLGCLEMASDTQIDNHTSQIVHQVLGYDVVDRCAIFANSFEGGAPTANELSVVRMTPDYGEQAADLRR